MACFNAKAHYKKAKELYFIGQVVKLPIQVKEAERDESYTKFKVGEWVLKVRWLYPVAGRPLHYSDAPSTRKPLHDTIHLESLITGAGQVTLAPHPVSRSAPEQGRCVGSFQCNPCGPHRPRTGAGSRSSKFAK